MPLVAKRGTPLSADDAEQLIGHAWLARFAAPIEPQVLRNLMALWDLETDGGRAQANHNFGNLIQTQADQDAYEDLDSGNVRRFRSFDSAESGAARFVAQMTSETRPHWRAGLLTGDPNNFVVGLKTPPAYFEADFNQYLTTFLGRWGKYPHLEGKPESAPVARSREGGGLILLALLLPAALLGATYAMRKR